MELGARAVIRRQLVPGLADLNENGPKDSYERINNGFELTRGECALNVFGDASSPPNCFNCKDVIRLMSF